MMSAGSSSVGATDIIAGYAAVVATACFIWEVYKWKASGPRIRFAVRPNRRIIDLPSISEDDVFVVADATNVGDRPTTIEGLGTSHYKNWLWRILRRPDSQTEIVNTAINPVPYTLEPGKVWKGLIDQSEIEQLAETGILICELYLSHKRKPKTARIRLRK